MSMSLPKKANLLNKKKMNQEWAYEQMINGKKVRHKYYSDGEFVFLNKELELETEEGYKKGTRFDEFWAKYQKELGDGWEIVPTDYVLGYKNSTDSEVTLFQSKKEAFDLSEEWCVVSCVSLELAKKHYEKCHDLMSENNYQAKCVFVNEEGELFLIK